MPGPGRVVAAFGVISVLLGACTAPGATPGATGPASVGATPSPTPPPAQPSASVPTAQPPRPVPTPVASATTRPALEWDGRLVVMVDQEGPALTGNAVCRTAEGGNRVATVSANNLGTVGGHRVHLHLDLKELPDGAAYLSIGQGMERLPPDAGMPERAGSVTPAELELGTGRVDGKLRFGPLTQGQAPLIGPEWPEEISGMVGWVCDPIPAGPTPKPAGATGSAKLSGSLSGIFSLEGADCPTPERPDGFLSGTGTMDTGEATLEVTTGTDKLAFVLYRTPGNKDDVVAARGPATIEAAGRGWAVHLAASPAGIGPLTLDAEWTCG